MPSFCNHFWFSFATTHVATQMLRFAHSPARSRSARLFKSSPMSKQLTNLTWLEHRNYTLRWKKNDIGNKKKEMKNSVSFLVEQPVRWCGCRFHFTLDCHHFTFGAQFLPACIFKMGAE